MHADELRTSFLFLSKDFKIKLNYVEFIKLQGDILTYVCLKITNSFNCI